MHYGKPHILLNAVGLTGGSGAGGEVAQPANAMDFSSVEELTFQIALTGVTGTPTTWSLSAKFQLCMPHISGNQYVVENWFDLQAEQASKLIVEGVGFYRAAHTPPTGGAAGVIADNTDTAPSPSAPLVVQRTIRYFGHAARVLLAPSFTGGSSPAITTTVVCVEKG
jgi:hypothetical protein